jgi:hypothetical protein
MIIEMAKGAVFWRNAFPANDGVCDEMSPRAIVTGSTIDFNRHCQYEFGEYVQTHEEHDNSMGSRTVGALALRPTGNAQGGYYFFSLSTGKVINRNRATKLPMPAEVVERVHILARRQNASRGLVFSDRSLQPIHEPTGDDMYDDGDDSTYVPSEADDEYDDDDDDDDDDDYDQDVEPDVVEQDVGDEENPGVYQVDVEPDVVEQVIGDEEDPGVYQVDVMDQVVADEGNTGVDKGDADEYEVVGDDDYEENPGVQPEDDLEIEFEARYGPRTNRYQLRPRRQPKYTLVSDITFRSFN